MREDRFKNQSGIINPDLFHSTEFYVVGAGAIGSFFVNTLAKMGGQKIHVYDEDAIEDHNIANQFYPEMCLGEKKVATLGNTVREFSGVLINAYLQKWTTRDRIDGFVVSAVDNMDVRKELWEAAKKTKSVHAFLDARMGAQTYRVYLIDMNDHDQIDFYEKTLYSSADAVQERCTAKSIIFTVLSVVGEMLNLVKKHLNKEKHPIEVVYDHITEVRIPTWEVAPVVEPEPEEQPAAEAAPAEKKETPTDMMEKAFKK